MEMPYKCGKLDHGVQPSQPLNSALLGQAQDYEFLTLSGASGTLAGEHTLQTIAFGL